MTHASPNALAVAVALLGALNLYAVFGGADFGGGVWDLLASGPRKREQRALIERAIGPIWEANHVWLVLVVVVLFSGFPAAFSRLVVTLHIPLSLMLLGIVFRGSAFVFRSYGSGTHSAQRTWGRVFAVASTITPVLLGVCIGAIASGRVGAETLPDFHSRFVAPWLNVPAFTVGALALALFAYVAAVFLTVEAGDESLRDDFRRRALAAAAAVFVLGAAVLAGASRDPHSTVLAVVFSSLSPLMLGATSLAALTAIWALVTRRYRIARVAAPAQLSLMLWGWAYAQYPFIVPSTISIADSAAPPLTLKLLMIGLAGGAVILVPSLVYLFRVFRRDEQ